MTKRIFRSICLVALAVFISSALLIMGVLYGYFSDIQQSQLHMQLDLAARGVEREGAAFFEGFSPEHYRITWINPKGNVLYDSQSDRAGMENHLEREEIQEALDSGYGASRRYSATLMERTFYTARRLEDGSVLRLSISQRTVLTLLLGMAQPICIIFLVAVGLSICFAVRLSKHIVRPLARLNLDDPLHGEKYEEILPLLRRLDSQQRQLKRQKTALEEQEAALEKAEAIRREFTANVSHELKTPLQSISGYAELLQNGMVKEEDIPVFAGRIYKESQRMARLVEDVISLSHLDEGALDMEWTTVDLYETAAGAIRSLSHGAQSSAVTLALTGSPVKLHGIPQLLYSIVYNLCDNAIKYNRPGGSVNVRIESGDKAVVLTIADTGIGIPEADQARIFERFYRVDKGRSKEVGGTGLGLSIVKHAALIHQANIALRSTPGEGTQVSVQFPVDAVRGEQRLLLRP